ncbi:hypothetical protein FOZ76_13495 [Verticiella sediminum]|uniref:Uncharacterized protein n=1 Tax=Verticiella sediminum TaxID=1247510 RepID=A0A556AM04_9BURK|nr:hypothetical protein [Verticiella sediminum]TSH93895.1 hypothetical protein FOZ76_13495 [Verticiella sediminum]
MQGTPPFDVRYVHTEADFIAGAPSEALAPNRAAIRHVVESHRACIMSSKPSNAAHGDMSGLAFLNNPLVQDPMIRNFEIIGEASTNIRQLYREFAAAHRSWSSGCTSLGCSAAAFLAVCALHVPG